jgi:hypothetical protein
MSSENLKMLLFATWMIAVFVVALALGVTSAVNWTLVACAAILPPVVARQFWRTPEQSMSESINDARR